MIDERELAIHPLVQESIQHNSKVISDTRSLSASLFGVCAGILGLESFTGFLFYLVGTLVISGLSHVILARNKPTDFFEGGALELFGKEVFGGMSSFVLTWTLLYGLLRA